MAVIQGEWVTLRTYGGAEIVRRVVGKTDRTILVCTDEEYELAVKENREPKAVGFSKEFVIGQLTGR